MAFIQQVDRWFPAQPTQITPDHIIHIKLAAESTILWAHVDPAFVCHDVVTTNPFRQSLLTCSNIQEVGRIMNLETLLGQMKLNNKFSERIPADLSKWELLTILKVSEMNDLGRREAFTWFKVVVATPGEAFQAFTGQLEQNRHQIFQEDAADQFWVWCSHREHRKPGYAAQPPARPKSRSWARSEP